MGVILAGDRSGTGKTTLTLALLCALKKRQVAVQSFKVGPDYIDPMFHARVTGRPCYNLDPVLTSERYVQRSYSKHCAGADHSIVEGVMGLFDGATGVDDTASTAHIARLLGLPVLLVVDCGRMARSLAALVQGYRNFDSRVTVVGVILNRVGSDRHLQLLRDALAAINMPIFGVFRREKDIQLPDRHLGLVPTGEVSGFDVIADRLALLGERCFDWDQLEPLLSVRQSSESISEKSLEATFDAKDVRLVVARDSAFNFYYPDNFEALSAQGVELVDWSPLEDKQLPDAHGLYFGGGFPEVFAAQLAENAAAKKSVKEAITQGMPTYAECGGLMYLSKTLVDFDGKAWPMANVIPQTVEMRPGLSLGYRKAIALADTPLLKKGQTVVGHEFHKSSVVETLEKPVYEARRYWGETNAPQVEGYCRDNLQASYLHVHWGDRPDIARRFAQQCANYARQK